MMTADLAVAPESTIDEEDPDDLEFAVVGSNETDEQDQFSIETETQYGSKGVVSDGGGGSSTSWTCADESAGADASDEVFGFLKLIEAIVSSSFLTSLLSPCT